MRNDASPCARGLLRVLHLWLGSLSPDSAPASGRFVPLIGCSGGALRRWGGVLLDGHELDDERAHQGIALVEGGILNAARDVPGGAGGAGTVNSYSGSSVTYAGGGGGGIGPNSVGSPGAGGAGGGGAGSKGSVTATAGTANTGGGGGGLGDTAGSSSYGGNGGSGIVIIRYSK